MRVGVGAIVIALFFVVMQAFALPPDGFMSGDQGSKYLQTRAFAEHGPLNPSIDVRSRDIDPDFKHQEPKLKNRRGRLVSEFMWLMPLLGSPFLALFGLRGLYVIPALSALAVFFCASRLARRKDDPTGALTAFLVLLVTPIAVYGLELWEHAPAAACVMVIAVLLLPTDDPGRDRAQLFAAGVVSIAAFLFREEAAVALPALFLGRSLARAQVPGRMTTFIVEGVWCSLGVIAGLIASAPMNQLMYGAPLPMHLTQDAWEYAKNVSYLGVRRDIVTQLFMPMDYPWVYAVALVAGVAAALFAWRHKRPDTRRDVPLAVVHTAVIVMLGLGVAFPLWRLASGSRIHEAYNVQSAAHGWAFVPALLYLPWVTDEGRTPHARYLIVSAVLAILFTSLVVPSTAGAQWSPRFYLQIAPLLALPAIEIAWVPSAPRRRGLEASAVWGGWAALVAAIVMLATGIVYLRTAKIRFAGVTHALARLTGDGEVVISNVFWVPEVTATLAQERRFLFSWTATDVPALAALAVGAGFDRFALVTYAAQTHQTAPDAIDVPGAPCRFVRGQRQFVLEIPGVFLSRYGCESP